MLKSKQQDDKLPGNSTKRIFSQSQDTDSLRTRSLLAGSGLHLAAAPQVHQLIADKPKPVAHRAWRAKQNTRYCISTF